MPVEKYMTALSTVRSPKEHPKPLVCLPACRAVICLLATPLFALAWQSATSPNAACQAAGQVAGWDIEEQTLSLKSDSGAYSDFHYDRSTTFRTTDATFQPDELGLLERLNIDDRVCVEAYRADNKQIASRIRVTYRAEIDARDKRELVCWQNETVFGAVKALDPVNHRIIVRVSASTDISVDAAGSVAFWILPTAAHDPSDTVSGGWQSLALGDAIYVRGERVTGMPTIRARLIVSGGFRTVAGSIESMEPLKELLLLRDFRSGRDRQVHFDFLPIYVVGKDETPGARDRRLYLATIGDLNKGDSVLMLGRENYQTGDIEAFLLITGFSPGGVLQPGPGQSADWIFQAIGFGRRRP